MLFNKLNKKLEINKILSEDITSDELKNAEDNLVFNNMIDNTISNLEIENGVDENENPGD